MRRPAGTAKTVDAILARASRQASNVPGARPAVSATGYRDVVARPMRYVSPEDEELVRRNPRAAEISRRLLERTKARVESGETGEIVEDPLGALIQEARSKS